MGLFRIEHASGVVEHVDKSDCDTPDACANSMFGIVLADIEKFGSKIIQFTEEEFAKEVAKAMRFIGEPSTESAAASEVAAEPLPLSTSSDLPLPGELIDASSTTVSSPDAESTTSTTSVSSSSTETAAAAERESSSSAPAAGTSIQ